MKVPDLWTMVAKMENKELSRFRKYLSSPYFNNDEKHLQLFDALYDQVKEKRCDREALDAILFPYKAYTYTRITNLISDLKKLLEGFFVQEELKSSEIQEELFLMKALAKRDLQKQFLQSKERIGKQIKEEKFLLASSYLHSYQEEDLATDHFFQPRYLDKKIKSLHLFYVLAMLKSVCQDLDKRGVIKEDKSNLPHRFFIQYIQNNHKLYEHERLARIYIRILQIQIEPDAISHFTGFTTEWRNAQGKITQKHLWSFFLFIENYAWKQVDLGKDLYKKELLELYKLLFEESWTYTADFMGKKSLTKIVQTAIDLKEEIWLGAFLKSYATYALGFKQEGALIYFQSLFFYHIKGDPRKALELLKSYNYKGHDLEEEIYILSFQVFFELYKHEELTTSWEEFSGFIKKSRKIGPEKKEEYQWLKKQFGQLLKLRTQAQIAQPKVFTRKREKVSADIQKAPKEILRGWLLEQLSRIK